MDGVLCDFSKKYRELFRLEPREAEKYKKFDEYFRSFIATEQFEKLEPMPGTWHALGFIASLGIPVEILSSTAHPENHRAISYQKELWLEKQGIISPRNFVPGKSKKKDFASPTHIIIDDCDCRAYSTWWGRLNCCSSATVCGSCTIAS